MMQAGAKLGVALLGLLAVLAVLETGLHFFGTLYAHRRPVPAEAGAREAEYVILCIGDSFVFGLGAPQGQSYPAQLERLLNQRGLSLPVRVVNTGTPGENLFQIHERLLRDIDAVNPDMVILLGGKISEQNILGYNTFIEGANARAALREFVAGIHLLKLGGELLRTLRRQKIDTPVEGPDNAPLFFHVEEARLCFERGEAAKAASDLPGAVEWYKKAWRLESSCVLPCKPLGELCEILGRTGEAEVWYRRYVAADGNDAVARERLSRVSYALHPREFDAWRAFDIDRIIHVCAERGKRLLLMNYPEDDYGYAALARAHGMPFVDQRASFAALLKAESRNVYIAADDSHCNSAGYGLMAQNVADKILELGCLREGENARKIP